MSELLRDSYEGYDMFIGDKPLSDVLQGLRQLRALQPGLVHEMEYPLNIPAEEAGLARLNVLSASGSFSRTRFQMLGALRAITGWALDRYRIPRKQGCDFGSGATGFMVHDLLKGRIQADTWREMDVHPGAVAENRRLHPGARIDCASYHRVPSISELPGSLQVATGLSSLDATQFVPQAVKSISSAIKPGGFFLHIQDVRPGSGVGPRAMKAAGIPSPYHAEALTGDSVPPYFLSFLKNKNYVSVGELFRQELGSAVLQDPSLELLGNHWVTARRSLPTPPGRLYYLNMLLLTNRPFEEASAVVTVARKKG